MEKENFDELRVETADHVHVVEGLRKIDAVLRELVLAHVLRQARKASPKAHFYTPLGRVLTPLEITRLLAAPLLLLDRTSAPPTASVTRYVLQTDRLIASTFSSDGCLSHSVSTGTDALSTSTDEIVPRTRPAQQLLRVELPQVDSPFLVSGVPFEELARHCSPADGWVAIDFYVYDVTHYLALHPGGPILARFLGRDASTAFARHHAWVNHRLLLANCFVGRLRLA